MVDYIILYNTNRLYIDYNMCCLHMLYYDVRTHSFDVNV